MRYGNKSSLTHMTSSLARFLYTAFSFSIITWANTISCGFSHLHAHAAFFIEIVMTATLLET